ncbi:MAG: hypothetical protein ACREV3_04715, partial [Gammaproteobacteria bacterium]
PAFIGKATNEGAIGEAQGILKRKLLGIIAGAGYYGATRETRAFTTSGVSTGTINQSHGNGYVYAHARYPQSINWTIGLSFDSLHGDDVGTIEHLNPKFGLQWELTPTTTVRGAVFRTLKRSLLNDQTLEPTRG